MNRQKYPVLKFIVFFALTISFNLNASDIDLKSKFKSSYSRYQELFESGKPKESLKHIKQAFYLGLKIYGDSHPNSAVIATNYYIVLMDVGKYGEAYKISVNAIKLYENAHGKNSSKVIPALKDAARASIWDKSAISRPHKYLDKALKLSGENFGTNSLESGNLHIELAELLSKRWKLYPIKVKNLYENANEIFTIVLGEHSPKVSSIRKKLGDLTIESGNPRKSFKYYEAALRSMGIDGQPDNKSSLKLRAELVASYEKFGMSENATKHCLAIGAMTPSNPDQEYIPLYKTGAPFPRKAIRNKKSGWVIVEYAVDEEGFVRDPVVIDSNGNSLFHQPSLEAILKFRYAPRFIDGKPTRSEGLKNKFIYDYIDTKVSSEFSRYKPKIRRR